MRDRRVNAEGKLPAEATIRRYRIVQTEGARQITREVEHYKSRGDHRRGLPRAWPSGHAVPAVDWTLRESARAKIRVMVKRILNKYGYPPDLQEEAVKTVLRQAELLCADWV